MYLKKNNKLSTKFNLKGYIILNLDSESKKELQQIQDIIIRNKDNLKLQNELYKTGFHKSILKRNIKKIVNIINEKKYENVAITSFIHLRTVKKSNRKSDNSFVGFHRETFYSNYKYTKYQINVTVPLMNYDVNNSMRIIEKSHKIQDNKIKTKKLTSKESGIKRFSAKHKLGLPYNPKIILSGVNLKKSIRVKLKTNQFMIFSGQLIHGNGSNHKEKERYSIDFGLIKKKYLKGFKVKDHKHVSYSSSGKYWEDLIF